MKQWSLAHTSWRETGDNDLPGLEVQKDGERERKEYPSGFNEALGNAVEERMAEVEKATFVQIAKLVQERSSL